MNISYEDYYKLCNYTNIDLTDESYLEDEERLRYIISKIKVKNPKKYFKEEDGFKVTKEIFEENKEDLIFMKYIDKKQSEHYNKTYDYYIKIAAISKNKVNSKNSREVFS